METNQTVYYPQDEMTTPLLPITTGCTYNQCAFCSMYKGTTYQEVAFSDIEMQLKNFDPYTERIFLTGADPLSIGFDRMKGLLELIDKYLPYCACVASYASIVNIRTYTVEDLSILHHAGLRLLYIGFESGLDSALTTMNKSHRRADALKQAKKLEEAQLPYNAIIMLGIGGRGQGEKNALATASMLSQLTPTKIITMNLRVFYGTPLSDMVAAETFIIARKDERLAELYSLLVNLTVKKPVIFDTTHPTNFIKMKGTLPVDHQRLIRQADRALKEIVL